jgi:hypothetical protein
MDLSVGVWGRDWVKINWVGLEGRVKNSRVSIGGGGGT